MNYKKRISRKDSEKVALLYENYRLLMCSEAYSILQDSQLAEDAVHQAFMRVIENLNKIDENDIARTRSFLVIICRNIAIDIYNKRARISSHSDFVDIASSEEVENIEAPESPCDIVIGRETTKNVVAAIESLPDIYRDVILLEKFHSYSLKEIAEVLKLNYETVKKRSVRGKRLLAEILSKEELM